MRLLSFLVLALGIIHIKIYPKLQQLATPTEMSFMAKIVTVEQDVLLTIFIVSSNATKSRLDEYLKSYYSVRPDVKFIVAYSTNTEPHPKYDYVFCHGCNDTRTGINGLPCKDSEIYKYFVEHPELGDFMYRAIDDTSLNVDNLVKLVKDLSTIYDPVDEIVFRGYRNDEHEKRYRVVNLGGGSGWLMSRGMAAIHQLPGFRFIDHFHRSWFLQDDTTETLILNNLGLKSHLTWSDPRWIEVCSTCNGDGNFSKIPECETDDVIHMNDVIAYHSIADKERKAGLLLGKYPDDIYAVKQPLLSTTLCRGKPGIKNPRTSLEYLKEHAEHMTLRNVKRRSDAFNSKVR